MGVGTGRNTPLQPLPAPTITPTQSSYTIERGRLDHLYSTAAGQLVRVLAPAGYGKSTLAARWARNDHRQICWLEVERGDDDPAALFAKVRDALDPSVQIPEPSVVSAPSNNPYVDAIRQAMTTGRHPEPFVLVIDDVHRLRSATTNWIIEVLVEHLPASSTLVLVGRSHHDHGSIGRFRLAPGVIDVSVDDLAFDASETHRFLSAMGIDPGTPGLREALDTLVGWPAGLRLATNAIQRGVEPPEVADQSLLIDYLRTEWLDTLDPDDHDFLRELACLERFTGTMCDEVLGRTGSSRRLELLHRNEFVVFGLDQRGEWYRLHPLVSRWLAGDLRSSDPTRWAEIHLQAASFWEHQHDIDRAIEHARAVGDTTLLERLIVAHGGPYMTRGAVATATKWLEALTPEQVLASPGLCGLYVAKSLHIGDEAAAIQWQRVLHGAVDAAGRPESEDTTWWPDVLSAVLEERPARTLLPRAAAARVHLTHGAWGAFACWVHGGLSFLAGDVDAARGSLAAGVFEAGLSDNPAMQAHCEATAAVIDACTGDLDRAASKSRQSIELLRSCAGEFTVTTSIDVAMAALVCASEGDRDAAARHLATVRRALLAFPTCAPWFNVIARIPLVRTALLLDDRDLSRALMHELEHHGRFDLVPDGAPVGAMACVADLRQQVDAMHQPASGASALTDAELRVLRLMPTNLSLGDIASRLFLSRNTVKSHAASIYRKLGAGNRSQAVDRAAAAGLITMS